MQKASHILALEKWMLGRLSLRDSKKGVQACYQEGGDTYNWCGNRIDGPVNNSPERAECEDFFQPGGSNCTWYVPPFNPLNVGGQSGVCKLPSFQSTEPSSPNPSTEIPTSSTSVTANSSNLGLILGLCIPFGLLFLGSFCILYFYKKRQKNTELNLGAEAEIVEPRPLGTEARNLGAETINLQQEEIKGEVSSK